MIASATPQPDAELFRAGYLLCALDAMEKGDLWPGFQPDRVPVAFFDGRRTIVVNHPSPPAGFVATGHGWWTFPGRHDAIRANTSTEIAGVLTAVASVDGPNRSNSKQAALLIHEQFHVYQRLLHPDWSANEMTLFAYPQDSEAILAESLGETAALRQALMAPGASGKACLAGRGRPCAIVEHLTARLTSAVIDRQARHITFQLLASEAD